LKQWGNKVYATVTGDEATTFPEHIQAKALE
jgi:hypothetical protein